MIIDNLHDRGNTASNSHFVALWDQMQNNRIQSGDSIFFFISGSGMTVGGAAYTFDDLPDRVRDRQAGDRHRPPAVVATSERGFLRNLTDGPHVRIESVGIHHAESGGSGVDTRQLVIRATDSCLENSTHAKQDIDILMYVGVYRTEFLGEPPAAAMALGDLGINTERKSPEDPKTLGFDIVNGQAGFLNACYLAASAIRAERARRVLIVAAECEENREAVESERRGLLEASSAALLDVNPDGVSGFEHFCFRCFADELNAFKCCAAQRAGKVYLDIEQTPDLEERYLKCIQQTVRTFLTEIGLEMSTVDRVFPPQISPGFLRRVAETLEVAPDKIVDVTSSAGDLFSSSTPFAFRAALDRGLVGPGKMGLFIEVAAGIQVACATYRF